jgi:hypothetical protein
VVDLGEIIKAAGIARIYSDLISNGILWISPSPSATASCCASGAPGIENFRGGRSSGEFFCGGRGQQRARPNQLPPLIVCLMALALGVALAWHSFLSQQRPPVWPRSREIDRYRPRSPASVSVLNRYR